MYWKEGIRRCILCWAVRFWGGIGGGEGKANRWKEEGRGGKKHTCNGALQERGTVTTAAKGLDRQSEKLQQQGLRKRGKKRRKMRMSNEEYTHTQITTTNEEKKVDSKVRRLLPHPLISTLLLLLLRRRWRRRRCSSFIFSTSYL